ncbi:MAG: hypothetical protein JKY52_02855 [Flavobacteriales bacterium]|nr:hypothetical protein [Flavobacteriales bacterium]
MGIDLKASISSFLVKILLYSVVLAGLAYAAVQFDLISLSIATVLSIQAFVLLVTILVHIFLMRSATAEVRIQKFMFNFMLTTTLKLVIYCGAFVVLIYLGNNLISEQYTNLSLFLILFGYYMLYTVFEVVAIVKFVKKIG